MSPSPRTVLILLLLQGLSGRAGAAGSLSPDVGASTPEAGTGAASAASTTAPTGPHLEGAVGLLFGRHPEYPGAAHQVLGVAPGFFLRWGRLTATNAGDFATRRADDVSAGLGLDLSPSRTLDAKLSLRLDGGRSEGTSAAFAGLGDVRRTLRARVGATWRPGGPFRVTAAWNPDLLHHGGGDFADFGLAWDRSLGSASLLTLSAGATLGDRQNMQAYFGITPAQSLTSAYPAFHAGGGWRDLSVAAKLRSDLGGRWIVVASIGASRLLGSAAASPLTHARSGLSLDLGAARRF